MRGTIKMPSTIENKLTTRQAFQEMGKGRGDVGLPGIDGAIDCTHIRLSNVHLNNIQEVYRNRKGFFSLNVQAVVGPSLEFYDIVPEWPGSQHDSRIFQNSRLHMRYVEGYLDGCLIGDAGYPCLPFLLTPLANPDTEAKRRYNEVHTRTRIVVERVFGIWKRRFPCLSKGLSTKLICTTTVIVACAVLHNMSLILQDVPLEEEYVEDEVVPVEPPNWQPGDGFAMRQALIDRIFI
ncbi:putative nuclease HARBI1 [Ischnura elegans]|uniref:putative nuclease HARBI1 n=1 Tax=Ischnura elegans TaxID=197161 RepID=UPI001ED893B1|nr:putative nuclease HARBI1 [Ischnura elegans]